MRILGIDPGSRITGYGVIDSDGNRSRYIDSGCVLIETGLLTDKLGVIFTEIERIVILHRPQVVSVEQVFVSRNVASALKLGHARGAAICAVVNHGLAVSEYSPRSVKQAVVGSGAADKQQIQHMVCRLLGISHALRADAADALAVALCHAHTCSTLQRFPQRIHGRRR
jgi:crossover junction endodeoxyribonuclease RuvC